MSKSIPRKPAKRRQPAQAVHDVEAQDDAVIGRALRGSLFVMIVLAVIVGGVVFALTRPGPAPLAVETVVALPQVRSRPLAEPPTVPFVDITSAAGIDFEHENGAYGDKLLPETMGHGGGFFDLEGDGDQDLVLVNSTRWPWDERPADQPATTKVYRNDGTGNFTDVTTDVGLDVAFYGMGVAVGDYDGDGDSDLFFSAVGPNRLFRNDAGRFVEVTDGAGVAGDANEWGTSCGWFDFNNDGRLDLFVCNYVRWTKEIDLSQDFRLVGVGRAYGPPMAFEGTYPYLYRNDGEGRFTDVSEAAGLNKQNPATGVPMAKSMGVAPIDLDEDGWLDLVVANDTVQNFLFHNQRDGTFAEVGDIAGIGFDAHGNARGAMGIDAARFRNDQTLGVAIGNFSNEMTALYCADEVPMQFVDAAIPTGLGPATRLELTFGLFFFDYDLDGRLDLLAANGHLEDDINKVQASQHYEQPPQLFWNCGPNSATEFVKVPAEKSGADFARPMVGRGAAFADIDADGDLDVLLTAVGGRPRLLRNDQQLNHHWLRVKLHGAAGNREAIGAWVELHQADGAVQQRQVMPTRSYLSQCELPVTFGLGDANTFERLVVRWPDGSEQEVSEVTVDQTLEISQTQKGTEVSFGPRRQPMARPLPAEDSRLVYIARRDVVDSSAGNSSQPVARSSP